MFNLSKHADTGGALPALVDSTNSAIDTVNPAEQAELNVEELTGGMTEEESAAVQDAAVVNKWNKIVAKLGEMPPEVFNAIKTMPEFTEWQPRIDQASKYAPAFLAENNMTGAEVPVGQAEDYDQFEQQVLNRAQDLRRKIEENAAQQQVYNQQTMAFNLKDYKTAQGMPQPMGQMPMEQPMAAPMPAPMGDPMGDPMGAPEEPVGQPEGQFGRFPVENEGDFISKFADDLLNFENMPGSPNYAAGKQAAEEILDAVSPGYESEADSILESVMQLDVMEKDKAANSLIKLYEVLLPRMMKSDENVEESMEPVMSETNADAIKGIVRYSLTDSVLNNQKLSEKGMIKTAADQFGQQYLLYGPTEKRICPKLRNKNLSVGDVVSEYTCRHHCEDGIVIDDNKTICGEALWRANVMDKFSTEYKTEDGETVGGYLNKRFEINRNIPEENRRRLKPGETRKPKPAAWGSTESRLQDMRSKEGQKRDYRPQVNTGDPFKWNTDVDQNNVEQSQSERDRREEAAGHQLVQYKNRDQGENNPKVAFNMKQFKTAQFNTSNNLGDDYMEESMGPSGALASGDNGAAVEVLDQTKFLSTRDTINKLNELMADPMFTSNISAEEWERIIQYESKRLEGSGDYPIDPRYLRMPTEPEPTMAPMANDKKQPKTADMPGEAADITMVGRTPKGKNRFDINKTPVNPTQMNVRTPADVDKSMPTVDGGKPMKKKQSGFNLSQFKTAQAPVGMTSLEQSLAPTKCPYCNTSMAVGAKGCDNPKCKNSIYMNQQNSPDLMASSKKKT